MKETDPQKKLDLLHQWEQKYPDSDFKGQRAVQIAQAESQIAAKALQPGTHRPPIWMRPRKLRRI